MKGSARRLAKLLIPGPARRGFRAMPQLIAALRLGTSGPDQLDPEDAFALLATAPAFGAQQKRTEIIGALREFASQRPRRILEIGAAGGGTSFLLSRIALPDSFIVSVDIDLATPLRLAMRAWARPRQRTLGLRRDSHSPETVREVAGLMGGPLDLLFIDGDHSYEGVKADFESYGPLVRAGGLIAFHDIIPDNAARGRPRSLAWSGGVPRFWAEIKEKLGGSEYVEQREQDGYGIGVVRWPGVSPHTAAG